MAARRKRRKSRKTGYVKVCRWVKRKVSTVGKRRKSRRRKKR